MTLNIVESECNYTFTVLYSRSLFVVKKSSLLANINVDASR